MPSEELTRPILTPEQMVRATVTGASRVFRQSDLAVREDRVLQRQMLNDPDVYTPLQQRLLSVALHAWQVEPEDDEDPEQVAQAQSIEKSIKRMRWGVQFNRHLLEAAWYGKSACNVIYKRALGAEQVVGTAKDESGNVTAEAKATYIPEHWLPIHPDSILFHITGEPAILINTAKIRDIPNEQVITPRGRAILLTPEQHLAFVLNKSGIEAPDFEVPTDAEVPFAAVGLRSRVWWSWWLKQKTLQSASMYAERLARGFVIARYPAGQPKAQKAAEETIVNLFQDMAVTVPVGSGADKEQYGFEIAEPQGTGWEIYWRMLNEYFRDQIQKIVMGQTLTQGTEATGLGSNVAEAHQDTAHRIFEYDARNLEDALTHGLVRPIQQLNWPESTFRHKFVVLIDKRNPKEFMEAVEKFVNMGGEVRAEDVRESLGIEKPEEGDEVIGGAGGGLFGPGEADDLLGGGGSAPGVNGLEARMSNTLTG